MGFGDHGFSMESTANYSGLKKVFDLGSLTSFTLRPKHSGMIFLCGDATLAVTLPAAADMPNGWNVMFIGEGASGGTLSATTTITGGGTDECYGHCVTGVDSAGGAAGRRQLAPANPGAFDLVRLHSIAARGDWVEFENVGSNYLVFGSSRIVNGLPTT